VDVYRDSSLQKIIRASSALTRQVCLQGFCGYNVQALGGPEPQLLTPTGLWRLSVSVRLVVTRLG
jgi:hypothetical protein